MEIEIVTKSTKVKESGIDNENLKSTAILKLKRGTVLGYWIDSECEEITVYTSFGLFISPNKARNRQVLDEDLI